MTHYTQLKEFERMRIYKGLTQGVSLGVIAQQIGRSKSTVSREIARNSDAIGYLYPRDAHQKSLDRKARHGSKIDRNPSLKKYLQEKAQLGWSPVVIAGTWNLSESESISAEAIYQFAYHKNNKKLELWKLFPRAKKKRGIVRKTRSVAGIQHRVPIHDRPANIQDRQETGHYEADLMFNSGSQSINILTVIERVSRKVILVKNESKQSEPVIKALKNSLGTSAKSCTFDNGKEFALHYKLKIPTYFCDPASPWQKGSVENMNGLLRRYLPFSMVASDITQKYLDQIAHTVNNTPRKKLGFLTPNQVFMKNNQESRVKSAEPALEVVFYQNRQNVALHI